MLRPYHQREKSIVELLASHTHTKQTQKYKLSAVRGFERKSVCVLCFSCSGFFLLVSEVFWWFCFC